MGFLRGSVDGGYVLAARCLVGRSRHCGLRTDDSRVSGEHAVLRWSGGWELRDLGSTNGTFLNGERIAAGEWLSLAQGDELGFGAPRGNWTLVDTAAPGPMAVRLSDGAKSFASRGLLALPAETAPLVTIHELADGTWVCERSTRLDEVADGSIVEIDGEGYLIQLPVSLDRTWDEPPNTPAFEGLTLQFLYSPDEEYVELVARHPAGTLDLGARSFHYMLMLLARARLGLLDDRYPTRSGGWVYQDELCRWLAVDPPRLNMDVFRARKHLGAQGILGSSGLVERRPGVGQLRLGTDRVELRRLDG